MKAYRVKVEHNFCDFCDDYDWKLKGTYNTYYMTYEKAYKGFENEIKELSKKRYGDNVEVIVERNGSDGENEICATVIVKVRGYYDEFWDIYIEETDIQEKKTNILIYTVMVNYEEDLSGLYTYLSYEKALAKVKELMIKDGNNTSRINNPHVSQIENDCNGNECKIECWWFKGGVEYSITTSKVDLEEEVMTN